MSARGPDIGTNGRKIANSYNTAPADDPCTPGSRWHSYTFDGYDVGRTLVATSVQKGGQPGWQTHGRALIKNTGGPLKRWFICFVYLFYGPLRRSSLFVCLRVRSSVFELEALFKVFVLELEALFLSTQVGKRCTSCQSTALRARRWSLPHLT